MPEKELEEIEKGQKLILEDRTRFFAGLIKNVENFTEEEILLKTAYGGLLVEGKNLKLEDLSIESGEILLTGRVDKIEFLEIKEKGGFFKKMFR